MLEHQKLVLLKVSSNPELFRKELLKSISWLPSYDIIKLYSWLKNNYEFQNQNVIREIFELNEA